MSAQNKKKKKKKKRKKKILRLRLHLKASNRCPRHNAQLWNQIIYNDIFIESDDEGEEEDVAQLGGRGVNISILGRPNK